MALLINEPTKRRSLRGSRPARLLATTVGRINILINREPLAGRAEKVERQPRASQKHRESCPILVIILLHPHSRHFSNGPDSRDFHPTSPPKIPLALAPSILRIPRDGLILYDRTFLARALLEWREN
jgi:hypothetical protein